MESAMELKFITHGIKAPETVAYHDAFFYKKKGHDVVLLSLKKSKLLAR